MIVFELWSPHGSLQERLEGACKVDETVAHEEEHTWVGDTNTNTNTKTQNVFVFDHN